MLLDNLTNIAPEALEVLAPEERHQFYKMLRLKVITNLDGSLEVNGAFSDSFGLCKNETPSLSCPLLTRVLGRGLLPTSPWQRPKKLAGTRNAALRRTKAGRGYYTPALSVAFEMARFRSS